MKSIWHPIFFGMLLMSTPLMAQMPGPPPPPLPPLSADQKQQVDTIRQSFEVQHRANVAQFEAEVKSILTPAQVARFNQLLADRVEFEKGVAKARQQVQLDRPPGPPPPLRLEELKLTPEQMGEVHVFHQALMEADHQGMETMRQKTMALLTPEQQAQMPPPPGMPPPPPPPPGDD